MSRTSPPTRTVVIGVGNAIRTDDGVGLHVVRELAPHLESNRDIELVELPWGGLRLMEQLAGFDKAIVIDALVSGASPGSLRWLTPDGLPTFHSGSSHDVDFATALEVGRASGSDLPLNEAIHLLGIEIEDAQTYSEDLTPSVAACVPQAVEEVLAKLEEIHHREHGEH